VTYLDACATIPFYLPEVLSEEIDALVRACKDPFMSNLSALEVVSVIARKVREGGMDRADASAALGLFESHRRALLYEPLEIGARHVVEAERLIRTLEHPLKTQDGIHAAACLLEGHRLVTADKQLARVADSPGIPTVYLEAA
jgi:predicted nucleic acid-binding protein